MKAQSLRKPHEINAAPMIPVKRIFQANAAKRNELKPGCQELSGSFGVPCPICGSPKSRTIDGRPTGNKYRRRRVCSHCKYRYTTYESAEAKHVIDYVI